MNHNILPYIPYTRYLLRQTSGSAAAAGAMGARCSCLEGQVRSDLFASKIEIGMSSMYIRWE